MSALDEKLQTPISKSQKITISACIAICKYFLNIYYVNNKKHLSINVRYV